MATIGIFVAGPLRRAAEWFAPTDEQAMTPTDRVRPFVWPFKES